MVETDLHNFLKIVGQAWLLTHGCFVVASEISVTVLGQKRLHALDNHSIIDVCGVREQIINEKNGIQFFRNNILGIEVKVSLNDYKNGFIFSACNFNYLLTPMNMLSPSIIPDGVGLIEFNKHKWGFELSENGLLKLKGLRLVKPSRHRVIPQFQVDNIVSSLFRRHIPDPSSKIIEKLNEA